MSEHDHSIWSCCYARGRVPADFMGGSPIRSNQGLIDIPMLYSIVAGRQSCEGRPLIAVDAGFKTGKSMTGRTFEQIEMPDAVLAKIGFRPEDVETLVLTHMHFDHAGNFDAFPNARIYLQRLEWERWREAIARVPDASLGKRTWALSSIDVEVFERFALAIAAGRVTLLQGDAEISPGVTCRLAQDTHTFGSQWVEIATASGPYVLAGDCVYWYANVEQMWPPGYVQGDTWKMLRTFEKIRAVVGEHRLDRIVPGHDMEVFSRHPSWTAGLNPIAQVHLASGERSRLTATPAR